MRKHVAQGQACIRCSKRNRGERKEGREGGRERERRGRRRKKESVYVDFQPMSGTMPAKIATTPSAHGVSITHQGMAAIFQS